MYVAQNSKKNNRGYFPCYFSVNLKFYGNYFAMEYNDYLYFILPTKGRYARGG